MRRIMLYKTSSYHIGILYLGGTIGCAGSPLQPLSADIFLPQLATVLQNELPSKLASSTSNFKEELPIEWHYFSGNIKDSSALVPEDWREILELLLNPQYIHIRHWIILHGTDTLAYTAAFLAAALEHKTLKIIVTGSQLPLLDSTQLSLNQTSDALSNIELSIKTLIQDESNYGWVRVAFNQKDWIADGVQKIHTQNLIAFGGQTIEKSTSIDSSIKSQQIDTLLKDPIYFSETLSELNIQIYYISPLPLDMLVMQLEHALLSGASAVILMAYGLGNLLDDLKIHRALLAAYQRGVMVILTTQVPFGGVESRYAAGNWLSACGVLSGGSLPISTIFARLAWLQITTKSISERRQQWLKYLATITQTNDDQTEAF
jgi:L-asparaginase